MQFPTQQDKTPTPVNVLCPKLIYSLKIAIYYPQIIPMFLSPTNISTHHCKLWEIYPQMKHQHLFLHCFQSSFSKIGEITKKNKKDFRDLSTGNFITFYLLYSENSTLWLKINEIWLMF